MALAKHPRLATLTRLVRQSPQQLPKPHPLLRTRAIAAQHSLSHHASPGTTGLAPSPSLAGLVRPFHVSAARRGIAESPTPRKAEDEQTPQAPADITAEEYHQLADAYLDLLVARLEEMQEGRSDVEVEFAAGVLTIDLSRNGTYVLNKQPPNKQIWLSSPITGPKRYDWVISGESMHDKEGGGQGEWVYLRDGSKLTQLLKKEIGVSLEAHEPVA